MIKNALRIKEGTLICFMGFGMVDFALLVGNTKPAGAGQAWFLSHGCRTEAKFLQGQWEKDKITMSRREADKLGEITGPYQGLRRQS